MPKPASVHNRGNRRKPKPVTPRKPPSSRAGDRGVQTPDTAQASGGQAATSAGARMVGGTHYIEMGVQPWDVFDTWPLEQRIGAYRANAVKYLMRLGTKDERLQEAKKAAHYCAKLVEVLEAQAD